jgi:hypothetical protein
LVAGDGGRRMRHHLLQRPSSENNPNHKKINTNPILFLLLNPNSNSKNPKDLPNGRIEAHSGDVIFVSVSFFLLSISPHSVSFFLLFVSICSFRLWKKNGSEC